MLAIIDIVDRIKTLKNDRDEISVSLLKDAEHELEDCLKDIQEKSPASRESITRGAALYKKDDSSSDQTLWEEITPFIDKINKA